MPARRFQLERRRAFTMIILYPIRNIFCVGYFPAGSERQRRGTDIGERRSGDIRERKLRCLHRNRFPHRANRPGGGSQVSFTSRVPPDSDLQRHTNKGARQSLDKRRTISLTRRLPGEQNKQDRNNLVDAENALRLARWEGGRDSNRKRLRRTNG